MILKEEVNRIKEIMGLKLITEQVLAGKYIKEYFQSVGKSVANSWDLADHVASAINRTGKSVDSTKVKNMFDNISRGTKTIDDYPEYDWYKIVDELVTNDEYPAFKSNFYKTITSDPRVSNLRNQTDELKELVKIVSDMNNPELTTQVNNLIDNFNKIIDDVFGDDPELVKLIKNQAGIVDVKKIDQQIKTGEEIVKDVTTKSVDNVVSDVINTSAKNWDDAVENEAKGGFRIYVTSNGLKGIGAETDELNSIADYQMDPRMYEYGKIISFVSTDSKFYMIPIQGDFQDAVGRGGSFSVVLKYPKDTKVTNDMVKPALEAKAKEVNELINSATKETGKLGYGEFGNLKNTLGLNDIRKVPFGKTN